jgi:hypothetical protein
LWVWIRRRSVGASQSATIWCERKTHQL